MEGLCKWDVSIQTGKCSRLKAQRKLSRGKSLLSRKEQSSGSGESAAVHIVQSDLTSFSDEISECDNDLAVVSTVEILAVTGSDGPEPRQEKEAKSAGGIPSR